MDAAEKRSTETYHVFDLLELKGHDIRQQGYLTLYGTTLYGTTLYGTV